MLSHRLKIAIIQTKIPYFKAAQLHKQNAVMYACAVRECACGARVCVDACVSACGARVCVHGRRWGECVRRGKVHENPA